MMLERKRSLTILLLVVSVTATIGGNSPNQGAKNAQEVLDQFVERLRWSHYWFGRTDLDDVYVEGKQISALFFWTKPNRRPKAGLCAAAFSLCMANPSGQDNRKVASVNIDPNLDPAHTFAAFARANYGDGDAWFPPLSQTAFEFEEKTVTLPPLGLPASIAQRVVPKEAYREAKKIKREFVCWRHGIRKAPKCTGTLVFAYYAEADPYWFTLRTCSSACQPEFRGDATMALSRGDRGSWGISGAGFMNSPKEGVERFKQKIEQAEMFRVKLP